MKSPAVALITFGCAKNLVDSEVMLGFLDRAGYRFVSDPDLADVVILNTCGFIGPSRDEADGAIGEAVERKRRRGGRVIVTGCYAERSGPALRGRYPEVDAWIGVRDFDKIVAVVRGESFRPGERTFLYGHDSPRVLSTPRGWAYLKVSEGCSHECAFCAIPAIKGPYRSRPAVSILREAADLADRGMREIVLISQDTTYFGRDRGRAEGLAGLLGGLARVEGLARIRFLYGYPEETSDALLEAMSHPKVCRYLDIPFQHADPAVVKRMRRTFAAARALRLLDRIRTRLPGAAVRTSVIVGFPGEGRREFERLQAFVREAAFDHLGVFTYSREKGTPAFDWGDPVPQVVKERRRDRILEIQAEISARLLARSVGRTEEVLIEGPWEKSGRLLVGRTRSQAPEVDGVVLVERPADWTEAANPIAAVEITHADVYDLHGRIAPQGPAR
ncbi:MAG: 30S ribosomal protein S12 methylthiotransferase RimO [Candidatus Aminicenantes bacterium]|nr:30S ribosomal protein S12 methylthiotransferase RimO [Candidatus Aminicenantes bacterium]